MFFLQMKALILGSTGMLGQALLKEARYRGIEALGLARTGADTNLDVQEKGPLLKCIEDFNPDVVINTVAIVDLDLCEKDHGLAYDINAGLVARLADIARNRQSYFIQISTDHYYVG